MPDLVFPTLDPQTTDTERLLLAKQLAQGAGAGPGAPPAGVTLYPFPRAPRRVALLPLLSRTATAVVNNIDAAGFRSAVFEMRVTTATAGWSGRLGCEIAVANMGAGAVLNHSPVQFATSYRVMLGSVAREYETGVTNTPPQGAPDATTRTFKIPCVVPPLLQFFFVPVDATPATYQWDLYLF